MVAYKLKEMVRPTMLLNGCMNLDDADMMCLGLHWNLLKKNYETRR